MSRRGLVINALVAMIAILILGGLAAQAVIRGPGSEADSVPVAAGIDGGNAFAIESSPAAAATRPTASAQPQPTTTVSPRAATTTVTAVPGPPETTDPPVPLSVAPIPPPPSMPVVNWPPVAPPLPPSVIQTGPASWSFEAEGITITASVSPAAPRVGDTLTISFTTGGEGELCCRAFVFVGSKIVGDSQRVSGEPCPPSPVTSGTATVVVSEPGPFTFQVHATRSPEGCAGPHLFTNVSLNATVEVLPPL